jgi:2-polyprenyl-3-methyl-5-hydroxy-6-metoxy-1,4-benzoquinol methylase
MSVLARGLTRRRTGPRLDREPAAAELEPNKAAEIRTAEESFREGERYSFNKPFARQWGPEPFVKWATITAAMASLEIGEGATVLDVGCGEGWTTLFLAEAGFSVTGVDLAPARVRMGVDRAARWGAAASFTTADMEELGLGQQFDFVLVYDALHHVARQTLAVRRIAEHLTPGGWVLFGEPSWLHRISPAARRTHRELGWLERGITLRSLTLDCRLAGLGSFKRFWEPTAPVDSRRAIPWQVARLVASAAFVAPHVSIWIAAQK